MPDQHTADPPPPLRGDEVRLFERLNARLQRAVSSVTHTSREIVEDACQHAWTQLIRTQPDRDTLMPWLVTVATREAIRLHRRRQLAEFPVDPELEAADPDRDELHRRALDALTVLASLPGRQRLYLSLHTAGYSYSDITALTNSTFTNVNKHLSRARATVRRHPLNTGP